MRLLAIALVLAPAIALSQGMALSDFVRQVALKKQPNKQTQSQPLPTPDDHVLELVKSGVLKGSGSKLTVTDGAEILYKGYRCLADSVEGDTQTQIFRFSGNVRVIGKDETVVGDAVTVDFKKKTFLANYSQVKISPNSVGNKIQGDAYLSGKTSQGNSQRIDAVDCLFTSCEYKTPHFHLDSEQATIEPGKQITFRKVKLNILGRNVISLPILWIPLGDRSFKYLPQMGQTEDEGFYIKNTYGFPMKGEDRAAVRTDYMSKLGTGLGTNYYYRNKDINGIARLYGVFGSVNTFNANLQHEQKLKWGNLLIDQDIQRNNYLTTPSATTTNTRIQANVGRTTTLSFSRQAQETGTFTNENQTFTLGDRRQFGKTNTTLDMTWNSSSGSSGSSRQTVDVRFQGQTDLKQASATLEYQRTIPIGEVANFFPGSDRTPVLTLRSDSKRLMGEKANPSMPFTTEMSLGEYLDPITQSRITRTNFQLGFNRAIRDKGPWRLDFNGNFQQGLYSDDTAQYRLNFGTAGTYSLGKRLTANLRYAYLRPFGYSPLAIDRTGITNYSSFDLSWMTNEKSSFGIQTGYDFTRAERSETPWQQVGIRSEYRLGQAFSLRTLSSYDTFNTVWSNIRLDMQWQTPTLMTSVGARYDAQRSTWSAVNLMLDGLRIGKTRIGANLAYNGYTKQFDTQQYSMVYDLHDAEAILTVSDFGSGFRSGREIAFYIRLKIIPFDTNQGFGRRGQAFGTGTGRDF